MDRVSAENFLKTLVSAYVWIANVDDVQISELQKFEHVIVQSQFATQFEVQNIRHYFKDMVSLFEQDEIAAIKLTRARLQEFCGKQPFANEIVRLGRAAMIADGAISDSEEAILKEIEKILAL
jgi:tellurite resistance protein